jgi:hypothetical protein
VSNGCFVFVIAHESREEPPFISLVDLIKNKTSTGRGKDRVDAEALQKRPDPK